MEAIKKRKHKHGETYGAAQSCCGGMYSSIDDFVDDLRRTFSNAIRYNPPSDEVHKIAKEMSEIFESKLKLLYEDKAMNNSAASVLKSLKTKTSDLKENHKAKGGALARTTPLQRKSSKKSISSTGIVVKVSSPYQMTRKSIRRLRADGKNTKRSVLEQPVLKGSNNFNIHSNNDNEVVKVLEKSFVTEAELLPKRALQVEALKQRYADTILRAKLKMEDCKRQCDRRSQVVAKEEQNYRESRIKQLRESARRAILETEERAEKIVENIDNMKDLEVLCGCRDASTIVCLGIPLKKLGLHVKTEYALGEDLEEEDERHLDEGEI